MPTQEQGQMLARSQFAARTMDAGRRALNAGAIDEAAYQTVLQTVRADTALPPALGRIMARFDTSAENDG